MQSDTDLDWDRSIQSLHRCVYVERKRYLLSIRITVYLARLFVIMGTNLRHDTLVQNLADWIGRTGAIVRTEAGGLHSKDRKRPDIVFWFEGKTHVIDVTVTDPFNLTNSNRINHSVSSTRANKSLRFDARSARYDSLHSIVEKRKNRHYKELIDNMQRTVYSNSAIQFHTAAAFTTGGLSPEFRKLIQIINVMAQREKGGWDPGEVMEGLRGCVGVTIQVGNAMVLNDSWN